MTSVDNYWITTPGFEKCIMGRGDVEYAANLPHRMLAEEIANIPQFDTELAEYVGQNMKTLVHNDPTVTAHPGERVVPLALYCDGVAFLKRDSVLGFWLTNLVTDRRHLVLVLRKRLMCRCGCLGWCSIWAALNFIAWTIEVLRSGVPPHPGTTAHRGKLAALGRGKLDRVLASSGQSSWSQGTGRSTPTHSPSHRGITMPIYASGVSALVVRRAQ